MKITISSTRVNGDHVHIESEELNVALHAYSTLDHLAKQGLFPAAPAARRFDGFGTLPGGVPTDAGVEFPLTEVSEERVVAEAPEVPEVPQRETEKPGKAPKTRRRVREDVAAATTTEAAPQQAEEPVAMPEPVAENVAPSVAPRVVSQDEAREAMTEAAKELGQPGLVKVLAKLGVARFGLYVADDYAPVIRAIEEVKAERAKGAA